MTKYFTPYVHVLCSYSRAEASQPSCHSRIFSAYRYGYIHLHVQQHAMQNATLLRTRKPGSGHAFKDEEAQEQRLASFGAASVR